MTSTAKANPVVFIDGMWIHSSAWQPWTELFASRGYAVSAPGWPGDAPTVAETRADPDAMAKIGIAEIVEHYAQLIGSPATKPIIVGHSFGGLVAQELLANGVAAAAVAIDPAGIKGVKALPFAQLRSAFPVLGNPLNRHRGVSLTARKFHYAFGNALTEEESDALHSRWTIPGPGLALFQEAGAEPIPAFPGKGRHDDEQAGAVAADLRDGRSHRPDEGDREGIRDLLEGPNGHRVPHFRRARALADDR
jgi:pimeloyl-ACP methyl ester carboxylesterase